MGFKELSLVLLVVGTAAAQNYRVCVSSNAALCQSLDKDGSQAVCEPVESNIDCAIKLAQGTADMGLFSSEELLLLAQQQPNDNRIVATVRNVDRQEPFAFEAVAVVPSTHTGGLEGLQGGRYCHPGLDESDQWSPRVLKTLERLAARTDRCPDTDTAGKTAEELEVETLNSYFSAACRPGPWSVNASVDANLKNRFPSLCSLCGTNCTGYNINMGIEIAPVSNSNRHVQALECLRQNGTVAFAAWQHVRQFFQVRYPDTASSFSLLCEDGTLRGLSVEVLNNATSACALVRQPWGAIVATASRASEIQNNLRLWWPQNQNPGGNTWQAVLFTALAGGANVRVILETELLSPANYTSAIRSIGNIDSTASCLPSRRWCTLSAQEQTKCSWVRNAAYTLGIQPTISCQQRSDIFECLTDIKEQRVDFITAPSNYGYIARRHYRLSPVKLVQNSRSITTAFSRVVALVKETSVQADEITRFENLRGKVACFPEFGGIAYVAFVRAAQERGVISSSECDYARAVGEFFSGACAPGAIDAAHALSESTNFNSSILCSACRNSIVTVGNWSDFTCAWDYSNMYFGNNGSLACLADNNTHVAFAETRNINAQLTALGLNPLQFRVLCRNNTMAVNPGVAVDDNCLLSYVVDAEILTRRNDPLHNSLNVLLDNLDEHFGYNKALGSQLINLEIYSPFSGISNLLFKDSAIGLAEPSLEVAHEPARNYIELFQHLESCTGAATTPTPGFANRNFYSVIIILFLSVLPLAVIN